MKQSTLLVVEDDRHILSSLEDILSVEGYHVLTAKNGEEAIEIIKTSSHRPALILLDMFMPVMDGWAFIDALNTTAMHSYSNIPIIIVSAAGDKRLEEVTKRVCGYLRKPMDIEVLLDMIQKVLKNSSLHLDKA